MARRDEGEYPWWIFDEEQRGQTAFPAKTLWAAGLLPVTSVGSVVTAHCGDAPTSPPWPQPKFLAAAPLVVFKQALSPRLRGGASFTKKTAHVTRSK
jgi:hypothetical protein